MCLLANRDVFSTSIISPGTEESHNKLTEASRVRETSGEHSDNSLAKAMDKLVADKLENFSNTFDDRSSENESLGGNEEDDDVSSSSDDDDEPCPIVKQEDSFDIVFENSHRPLERAKNSDSHCKVGDSSIVSEPSDILQIKRDKENYKKERNSTCNDILMMNSSVHDFSHEIHDHEVGNNNRETVSFEDSGCEKSNNLCVHSTQNNISNSSQGIRSQNEGEICLVNQSNVKMRRVQSQPVNSSHNEERPRTLSLGTSPVKVYPESKEEIKSLCSKTFLYIQMELCQKESLKDWLFQNQKREQKTTFNIFNDIVRAVEYVHDNQLMHRDLKVCIILVLFSGKSDLKIFCLTYSIFFSIYLLWLHLAKLNEE